MDALFFLCLLFLIHMHRFVIANDFPSNSTQHDDDIDLSLYLGLTAKPAKLIPMHELPDEFNWCDFNGISYCTASWNQHIPVYCGSCYVHGALSQVNDRLKIAFGGKHDVMLARQVILNCGKKYGLGAGCDGGEAFDVYEYMRRFGLPDESCQLYKAVENPSCEAADICHNCMPIGEEIFPFRCWAVNNPILYFIKEYGRVSGENAMMSEIISRGPITCGFASTDEFDYEYRGGIFIDTTNATDMNHDVEIVGWGVEKNVPYWIARNSWGTYWGENSFFRVIRGTNNMQIEKDCSFSIVDDTPAQRVLNGDLVGSMYGLVDPRNRSHVASPQSNYFEYKQSFKLHHHHGRNAALTALVEVVAQQLTEAVHDGADRNFLRDDRVLINTVHHESEVKDAVEADAKNIDAGGDIANQFTGYPTGKGSGDSIVPPRKRGELGQNRSSLYDDSIERIEKQQVHYGTHGKLGPNQGKRSHKELYYQNDHHDSQKNDNDDLSFNYEYYIPGMYVDEQAAVDPSDESLSKCNSRRSSLKRWDHLPGSICSKKLDHASKLKMDDARIEFQSTMRSAVSAAVDSAITTNAYRYEDFNADAHEVLHALFGEANISSQRIYNALVQSAREIVNNKADKQQNKDQDQYRQFVHESIAFVQHVIGYELEKQQDNEFSYLADATPLSAIPFATGNAVIRSPWLLISALSVLICVFLYFGMRRHQFRSSYYPLV